MPDRKRIAAALLDWYDRHARALPWRAPPGAPAADPYAVWLSEVMLQQTTVAAVMPYHARFLARWPTVTALAEADEGAVMAAWAGLGYYSRARNLIACARAIAAAGGRFPDEEAALRALPGIGAYTAAAIAAIAFGRPATVVDGNVERVVTRLFAIETPLPAARAAIGREAGSLTPAVRPGDHAQAMMDLGATICVARAPKCLLCPLSAFCAGRASGAPTRFPVKAAKAVRPERRASLFRVERDGFIRLVRRPSPGLLGGMLAPPMGPIAEDDPGDAGAPFFGDWHAEGPAVRHGFTHFTLTLQPRVALLAADGDPGPGEWWPIARLDDAGLPTLFAKALGVARTTARAGGKPARGPALA